MENNSSPFAKPPDSNGDPLSVVSPQTDEFSAPSPSITKSTASPANMSASDLEAESAYSYRRAASAFARKRRYIAASIIVLVTLIVGGLVFALSSKAQRPSPTNLSNIPTQEVNLNSAKSTTLAPELKGAEESLLVNGSIITKKSLRFSSGTFQGSLQPAELSANQSYSLPNASGTFCLDNNNCGFATAAQLNQLSGTVGGLGGGVRSLQGQTGDVTLTAGAGISINGTTIINRGVLAVSGTANQINASSSTGTISLSLPQDIAVSSTPSFAGLSLGAPLSVSNGGTGATTAAGARVNLVAAASGANTDITSLSGLTTALSVSQGGTGLSATPTNGQLPIGNGAGFALSTLTAGSGINISNGAGTISISSPNAGSCSTCANTSLSNLSSVAIQGSSLLTGATGIDLGSATAGFRDLYTYGSGTRGTDSFKITGTPTGNKVITLQNLTGTVALVQSAGTSTVQTGDIQVDSAFIAPRLQTNDTNGPSTNSGALTIRSGNALGVTSNSGNVSLDAGSATATTGTLTIGGTNASDLILGRSGLQAKLPGGLTTQGGALATANGNLTLGSGTITTTGTVSSGTVNGQTISSAANFTGTVTIQGASSLTLGQSSGSNLGAILFKNGTDANTLTLKSGTTLSNFSLTLPTALGSTNDCLKQADGTGTLSFQSCAAGASANGTSGKIAKFNGASSLVDSLLSEGTNLVSLQGTANTFTVEGKIVVGLNGASGNRGGIDFLDGTNPGRTLTVQAQQAGSGYTLQLPTSADVGTTCLTLVNVSAGLNKITGGSCAAGGSGGNITASGTTNGRLARFTSDGPSYTAAASLIQDDSAGIGINIAPQSSYIFTAGSGNKFKVTDAGQLEVGTTGSSPLTLATTGAITNINGLTYLSGSGGFDQSTSTGTFKTGSGAVSLNGDTTVASGKTLTVNGLALNADANNTVATADLKSSLTKNDSNTRTFFGVNIQPTLNAGASNANTTLNVLNVDTTNTATTGVTTNLLRLGFGGTNKLSVNSAGNAVLAGTLQVQSLSTAGVVVNDASGNLTSVAQLSANRGGTGNDTSASLAGASLLFNATTGKFVGSRITSSGGSITPTYGDGTLNIEVNSCSTCANTSLSNLSSVAIQGSSLLTGATGIDLGSATAGFRDLYTYGSGTRGTDSFKITGTPTGNKVITLPNATGTVCLDTNNCSYQTAGNYINLQATTPGSAQTGNINITGTVIAGTVLAGYNSVTGGVAAFNGNVGIGTSAPSASLHVAGTALIQPAADSTSVLTIKNAAGSATLEVDTANDRLTLHGPSNPSQPGSQLITTPDFTNAAWTSTGWTTTTTTATHTTGNTNALSTAQVSIVPGRDYYFTFTITGSPSAGETITPSLGGYDYLPISGNSGAYVGVIRATNSGSVKFTPSSNWNGTISNVTVKLLSLGGAELFIDDGIAPSTALYNSSDVQTISKSNCSTCTNGSAGINLIVADNSATTTARGVFKSTRARGTAANPTVPLQGDNVVSLLGAVYDGVTNQATALITTYVDGAVSPGVAPQRIGFITSATDNFSRAERLTVSPTGNIGIGNTSPAGLLQVNQITTGPGTVTTNGTTTLTGTGTQFTNTFKVGDSITVSGETVRTIASIASDTSLTVNSAFSTSTFNLGYTVTGGTRLIVQANGNVGIGATAPTSLLVVGANPTNVNSQSIGSQLTDTNTSGSRSVISGQLLANPAGASSASYAGINTEAGTAGGNAQNLTASLGLIGAQSNLVHRGSGTVTGAVNFIASDASNTGGGTISNLYGLYVGDLTTGVNNYGARLVVSSGTNKYNIYASGTAQNYFAGNVGIGTAGALSKLDVRQSANNTDVLLSKRFTDTSPTGNFLRLQDAAGADLVSIDIAGNLTVKSATINGTLTVNGHIITSGTAPTIAAGAAACTTPTVSISGTDTAGTITVTTGTGCSVTGTLATISFNTAYGAAPRVIISPDGINASNLKYYTTNRTTTAFDLATNTAPTNSTAYTYNYQVLQ